MNHTDVDAWTTDDGVTIIHVPETTEAWVVLEELPEGIG